MMECRYARSVGTGLALGRDINQDNRKVLCKEGERVGAVKEQQPIAQRGELARLLRVSTATLALQRQLPCPRRESQPTIRHRRLPPLLPVLSTSILLATYLLLHMATLRITRAQTATLGADKTAAPVPDKTI